MRLKEGKKITVSFLSKLPSVTSLFLSNQAAFWYDLSHYWDLARRRLSCGPVLE